MVKIGYKTGDFSEDEHVKDFEVIELLMNDKHLGFNIKNLIDAKEKLKGKEISMHSINSRMFSCVNYGLDEFMQAEIGVIKAEIISAKILGIKEIIMHSKQEKVTAKEEKLFLEIFNFAREHGVEIIYESNNKFIAETCLYFLEKFTGLNYNLDLGHLNTALGNKTFGMELDEFLEKVKNRVVYVHAHNNNGMNDEHKGLEEGTLDWKHVLDMLDFKKIRKIVMEVRDKDKVAGTRKLLENYLKNRKIKYN